MTGGNQIYVFLVCVACGIASGVFYDFFYSISAAFRQKWVKIVTDICFFVVFAGLYLFLSVLFELPSLRFFMLVGCLAGLFLYLKSIHKIVAFLLAKVYNAVKKIRKEEKRCTKSENKSVPKYRRKRRKSLQ